MILVQKFKTLNGAIKRARFEATHPTRSGRVWHVAIFRYLDGKLDNAGAIDWSAAKQGRYHYQIERS